MQKYVFMLLLIPAIGIAQTKSILTSSRLFPKNDKTTLFEKALTTHAQKYHKGDVRWRIWTIESGPDAGGYMISEGPSNWKTLDGRGDISAEHTNDWNNNVIPLTVGKQQRSYLDFQPDLSTVQLTDYADKIVITHMTAKPGKINDVINLMQRQKKVWDDSKESYAVYANSSSGEPGFIQVQRLRNGLQELAGDYRKSFADRYNTLNGAGSFNTWLKDYSDAVQSRWSELLTYRPNLSSK